jgi:hypothetical protein
LNFEICITHSSNLKLQSYFPRLFGCTDFIDGIYSVGDLRFYLSFLLGANQLSALSPSLYACTCFADSKHSVGDVGIPHEKAEKHASFF